MVSVWATSGWSDRYVKRGAGGSSLSSSSATAHDWSGGYVGVYRHNTVSAVTQFDDFTFGLDNNADGDIADAGDDVLVADDFNSNVTTLTYDNGGNCTYDGVFTRTYDAWNRLRKNQLAASGDTSTVQEQKWLGDHRLASRAISNSGTEAVMNDGGNRTNEFYYANGRVVEDRNGSNQSVMQYLWGPGRGGVQGQIVFMDRNDGPSSSSDCDPDVLAGSESVQDDKRYYYQADQAGRIVALLEYGAGVNGRIIERYRRTHGLPAVYRADTGAGELASARVASAYGNPFFDGLPGESTRLSDCGGDHEHHGEPCPGDPGSPQDPHGFPEPGGSAGKAALLMLMPGPAPNCSIVCPAACAAAQGSMPRSARGVVVCAGGCRCACINEGHVNTPSPGAPGGDAVRACTLEHEEVHVRDRDRVLCDARCPIPGQACCIGSDEECEAAECAGYRVQRECLERRRILCGLNGDWDCVRVIDSELERVMKRIRQTCEDHDPRDVPVF